MGWGEPSCYHVFCLTLSPFRDFLHLLEVLKECLFLNSDCHCKGPETCFHMLRNKSKPCSLKVPMILRTQQPETTQKHISRYCFQNHTCQPVTPQKHEGWFLVPFTQHVFGCKNIGHIVTSLWIQVIIYLFFYPKCLGK